MKEVVWWLIDGSGFTCFELRPCLLRFRTRAGEFKQRYFVKGSSTVLKPVGKVLLVAV